MFQLITAEQTGKGTVISFKGVKVKRTTRQYPYLVGFIDPSPRKYIKATSIHDEQFVGGPPEVVLTKGTRDHAVAERTFRKLRDMGVPHPFILSFTSPLGTEIVQ